MKYESVCNLCYYIFYMVYLNNLIYFLLTSCYIQGKAATAGLDNTRRRTIRPIYSLFHSFRSTPFELLQKTVYLRFYTRRGVGHRFHRSTENKHNAVTCLKTLYLHRYIYISNNNLNDYGIHKIFRIA